VSRGNPGLPFDLRSHSIGEGARETEHLDTDQRHGDVPVVKHNGSGMQVVMDSFRHAFARIEAGHWTP
jgi:hypothetical protein